MDKKEHKGILDKIKELSNTPETINLLHTLEQDYGQVLTDLTTAQEDKTKAENEATEWAKLNSKLWAENSAQDAIGKETITNDKEDQNPEPPQKLTYGNLEAEFEKEYGGN
jgi:hypothetical protein